MKPNDKHNPDTSLDNLNPMPGQLIIHRALTEKERYDAVMNDTSKVILHVEDENKGVNTFPLNCGLVLKAGKDCGIQPGSYVFWCQLVDSNIEWKKKPQPIVYDYTNVMPAVWIIAEMDVLAWCPPK